MWAVFGIKLIQTFYENYADRLSKTLGTPALASSLLTNNFNEGFGEYPHKICGVRYLQQV